MHLQTIAALVACLFVPASLSALEQSTNHQSHSFDYIIIGSGPAGSVLANRLSSVSGNSVLLLEAGENHDNDALITDATSNLYNHFPEYFWPGQMAPQAGLGGRSLNLSGGRIAGGGSSVNGEIYVHPTPFVLEHWQKIAGDQWSPREAGRHFKQLENYLGQSDNPSARGTEGELAIRQVFTNHPALVRKLGDAMAAATGHPVIEDYNNPDTPIGPFYSWQLYQKPDGKRASASVSFLTESVQSRPNLTVMYATTVTKILFDDNRNATGVEYIHEGVSGSATGRKKIILSAGIHSSALLMHSGIGPRKTLEQYDIPVVYANDNVGQHLANDAYATATFRVRQEDAAELAAADRNGKWPGGAFLPDPRAPKDSKERSIQVLPAYFGGDTIRFGLLFVNPVSRGYMTIQSKDPLKMMFSDQNLMGDKADVETFMQVFRTYIVDIARELEKIDSAYSLVAPTKEVIADDEALLKHIQASFAQGFHEQCQNRMAKSAEEGVVNGWGEVFGVQNLIVADASIIPYHMDGNTSAPSYLIGSVIAEHLMNNR